MAGFHGKISLVSHTKLPDILHPASQPGNPETLSVRGIATNGKREEVPGLAQSHQNKKPFLQDILRTYQVEQLDSWEKLDQWANVDKKHRERNGKEDKDKVPSNNTQSSLKAQCEEIQNKLFEKINSDGFYYLKNLFWSNDPEGRGRVSRESLPVLLATFLGHFVSTAQCDHLLQRLQLGNKRTISFDAFYDGFKREENSEPPDWLDPMKRKHKPALKEAHEVHLSLKEMAENRYFQLLKYFPKENMNSFEFRGALSKLGLAMKEKEYEKLWNRYVAKKDGILRTEGLFGHLGIVDNHRSLLLTALEKVSATHQIHQPSENVLTLLLDCQKKKTVNIMTTELGQ
ncbi:uncharacterized protein LOC134575494 [Pelobates fuscus]|uniref:uncharacterized protein LOC134575494 n=1 Tax=Pelobates fuscus TaxID=191477 RepID=UPI002FE47436